LLDTLLLQFLLPFELDWRSPAVVTVSASSIVVQLNGTEYFRPGFGSGFVYFFLDPFGFQNSAEVSMGHTDYINVFYFKRKETPCDL